MSNLATCPDRQDLERLHLGLLSLEQAAALDEHLLACEHCCQVLHELDSTDPLGETLRALSAGESMIDDRVQAVMARLKEMTLPGKAVEETLLHGRDATTDAWDLEKLLDPPQAEGELGRFGGYRVLRVLGAGGMGLVFEAEDPQLRRRVALKVMQRSLAAHEENRQRFLREARATAAIEHAHIVTVHQVGEHNGLPFLAMQLLKGESLQDRLERAQKEDGLPSPSSKESDGLGRPSSVRPALPLAEVLRIGREIAEALAEAHSRNLIHRDIKPGNIWLEGASGWVKLVDFGLAHAAEDVHLTQTGAILGTPAYMSPEQARGEAVDGRSDLYSLGAVLYKLATGDVPFRGASTMAVLMALATQTPRPPIEINPDIPPALNDLVLRLLAKKPDDRYESAMAVAEAIRQIETSRVGIAHHEPADVPARRRPRWPLVAAAAAAAFLLATIVIIVHDKDGKEVFRATVPDGGSLTVNDGDSTTRIEPTLPDSSVPPKGESPPPSRRAGIAEPPPLEEWLKGRTMLTVAQDGSGKFKTIQAALEALQAGQVVKVLDRGPYRERLEMDDVPADTGLVAEKGAVLELPAYVSHYKDVQHEYFKGHAFGDMDGFRLAGFTLAFPSQAKEFSSGLQTHRGGGFLLERCWVQGPVEVIVGYHAGGSAKPIYVRDCRIEGILQLGSVDNDRGAVLVTSNLFSGAQGCATVGRDSAFQYVGVRGNIFASPQRGLEMHCPKQLPKLEINNNTFLGRSPILFVESAPWGETVIYNNLRLRAGLAAFVSGAENDRDRFLSNSRIAHNCYPSELTVAEGWEGEQIVPRGASDLLKTPKYVSKAAGDRDYLRPVANDPIAAAGIGGEWPSYIGALPPGPAPKEGDWFTRLRERWTTVGWALPTVDSVVGNARPTIVEPPPLEEWLKGRTVLTVAQDGSGQFKTIQAALDALKPHQAVMVLDSRIYRETLHVDGLPDDVGLVSQRQATIELTAWPETPNAGGLLLGHTLNLADGFRLSGLRFAAPPTGGRPGTARMFQLTRFSGLVIEDCYFGWTGKHDLAHSAQLLQMDNDGGTGVSPIVLRNCLFDSGAVQWDGEEWSWPGALVVERCFFNRSGLTLGAMQVHDVMFRHNVFLGGSLWVHRLKKIIGALEISNNTALLGGQMMFNEAPTSGIKLCNNLMDRDVSLGEEANKLRAEIAKGWRRDHNGYALRSELPKSPTDVTDASGYLSSDPASRDFARIPDGSALARGGAGGEFPAYIGALPPGPAPKEGDWFTRLRERWTKVGWALPTTESTVGDAQSTIIPEPPPLQEWLKGRTVLTVAQDGSGQFKTIQSALNALKPHQVVKVLDRGPYRESIHSGGLPDDTGLISDRQATVETLAWPDSGEAHAIGPVEKFRLAGIRFVAPPRDSWGTIVFCGEPSGLIVEDCCFSLTAALDPSRSMAGLGFTLANDISDDSPIVVRDCLFDYAILSIAGVGRSTFVIERNYFRNSNVGLGDRLDQAIVRHNVFDGEKACFWIQGLSDIGRMLEIRNNTAATGVTVVSGAPLRGVSLRNNITGHDVNVDEQVYKLRGEMAKNWRRDHNSYLRRPLFAKSPTDVTVDPAYLSLDPTDRNYLRIPADGPQATGGAGGELPSYMGALPPGPAPEQGDWFTRLRERWTTVGWALPTIEPKVGNARPTIPEQK